MSAARQSPLDATDAAWNAAITDWLAGLFMAPMSDTVVGSYQAGLGASFLLTLLDEPGCGAGALRMQAALAAHGPPAAAAREFSAAFTRLFYGVCGTRTVSLYESAHVGEFGRLFQAAAGEMDRLLRHSDVATDAGFREPSDHLAIELALFARLMRADAGGQAQADLLDDHLLVWVPIFAEQCCDNDPTGFYAGVAQTLAGFLAARRAALDVGRIAEPVVGETPCHLE